METTCLNCGHQYVGNFCSSCGQKARTHRVTFSTIADEIPHTVFHVDKGFFYTLARLMKQPGKVIREFLDGKRISYFQPLSYLIILSTFCSFVSHIFITETPHPKVLFPNVATFYFKHPAVMYSSLIPLISLWSWSFNRRAGYNYWEHTVLNTYLVSQFIVLLIAYKLLIAATDLHTQKVTVILVLFFAYFVYAYTQFFGVHRSLKTLPVRFLMFAGIALTLLMGLTVAGFMTPWLYFN
ncbi:DUF3667 domain-containing protein [Polluticoccus soli]|uniref:DUF3667 domain-containing protein n=1 Tax=Polluticoccus soli TaxID=3034150 RepID=UPI0023E13DFF|nr:DUF3667 domain-containing protein [Flavipsychrobacter sp. JY13-12]